MSARHEQRAGVEQWRSAPDGGARIGAEITRANKTAAAVLIAGLSVAVVCGWVVAVGEASKFWDRHNQKVEVVESIMTCKPSATYRPSSDSLVGQEWVVHGAGS